MRYLKQDAPGFDSGNIRIHTMPHIRGLSAPHVRVQVGGLPFPCEAIPTPEGIIRIFPLAADGDMLFTIEPSPESLEDINIKSRWEICTLRKELEGRNGPLHQLTMIYVE